MKSLHSLLDRDSARWGLPPIMVDRRRLLFWNLFVADSWTVRAQRNESFPSILMHIDRLCLPADLPRSHVIISTASSRQRTTIQPRKVMRMIVSFFSLKFNLVLIHLRLRSWNLGVPICTPMRSRSSSSDADRRSSVISDNHGTGSQSPRVSHTCRCFRFLGGHQGTRRS